MNRQFVGVVVAGALALLLAVPVLAASESKALDPGAMAPDFTATASLAGKDFNFSLKQALAKGPVVVYFYPEADAFAKAGATIIGVSADSVARLNQFSADPKYCAGKFAVASDPAGKIAATYGLAMMPPQQGVTDVHGKPVTHGFLPRTTFVLDHAGKVVARLSSKDDHLSPDQHVHRSLEIVEKLQAGKAP